uniref:5'-3' exoribonuclease n=1 Tax=Alexandrium catenella TaxID=2925 RepID=A0A7S1PZE9_ALECA|mmetsp:Transcript_117163/g.311614  ORF Transcript_117163/g.311614 Transcript_117163/m.311614 type:complete len:966 (+) Transcript_117163:90-2987(+)|eukprot:CAMPEP_0171187402 /NCGR_PEP_ID=MMETSP0790-20130122/17303_1 /TAXON_ID=2925 /ORGANISM="Alexandrium catenella, Strain OF101" /LENGTH=965 /DNA_ID=CAMNT_0011652463 /DNA_START=90 /DNA_END=2987 /DNA_ORIENTATION=-
MGVPTFFRWCCVRYPKIVRDTIEREPVEMDGRMVPVDLDEDSPNGDFDNLYLDMNGIIHPCCHPEDGPAPEDEEHMYENIFLYLDRLVRIVRPKKLIYMAIDGVAPRAKMNQQRARRFRAAQEREEMARESAKLRADWEAEGRALPNRGTGKFFDSNVITPGTNFLHKMSEAIRYYIHDRTTNDPLWQKLKCRVILSDANIPSEGEHKIMDYIRAQRQQPEYDPNTRHCLYGADADLIMLGLATHEAHFSIIREVVMPKTEKKCSLCGGSGHVASECTGENEETEDMGIQKPFQILSIPIMRQYLMLQYQELEDRMPDSNPYDFERCVDDFVFMCFFVGNDFLPHLPSLSIRDGSIDQMLSLYSEILPSLEKYLTDCGQVNLVQVEQFLEYLGGIEDQVFKNRLEREAKKRSELDEMRAREDTMNQNAAVKAEKAAGQMGGDLASEAPKERKAKAAPAAQASSGDAHHAQLLAASFSMDLDNLENAPEGGAKEEPAEEAKPVKPKSGKFVSKEFHAELKDRLQQRQDLGEAMADTVRLGEGPHWKQRYYFEKFKVKQDDLVDFLQRIRKAYIEGLCWVLVYYYQGCQSWTWFYPYHYAPFASDLIGCATLKCGDLGYFQMGKGFLPFQQLMSVLPPGSAVEAGIPAAMRELMNQPFSPIIDFYPADFGLDLNGKRFTWQAVILLPFIDEPRLVRILAPLLKRLNATEKVRNRRGQELIFGHRDDKMLFQAVQLAQAAFEAGHAAMKQDLRQDAFRRMFGKVEGWQYGGANREIVSPIEGLPDVDESHALSSQYHCPPLGVHVSKLLPGINEQVLIINAADMDEQERLKGFGGEPAKRLILQALGRDPDQKPRAYKCRDVQRVTPQAAPVTAVPYQQAAKRPLSKVEEVAAPVPAAAAANDWLEYEEDESEFGDPTQKAAPAPPAGTKVIRVHASGADQPQKKAPKAPAGFKSVRTPGQGSRAAPY